MPGKKQQKNAFWYYIEDFKKTLPPDQQILPRNKIGELASPSWEKLPAEEKAKYTEKAKHSKPRAVKNVEVKFTTTGRTFEEIDKEEKDRRMKEKTMKTEIKSMVALSVHIGNIADKLFYLIHCNRYCYVQDVYYPCELALCEYSLKDGIRRTYHTFIDPGPIPLGYKHEVFEYSKDTHKVPHPPPSGAENDYYKLYEDVCKFISAGCEEDGRLPPVFTYYSTEHHHYNMTNGVVVESVLEQFCAAAGEEMHFRVYPLTKLFTDLHNNINVSQDPSEKFTEPVAHVFLERDTYSYQSGLSCRFHEEEDNRVFCSLSLVQRWTFPMSLTLCKFLNLTVVPGDHFPANMKIEPMPQTQSAGFEGNTAASCQPTVATRIWTRKAEHSQATGKTLQSTSHSETVRKPSQASLASTYRRIPKSDLHSHPDDHLVDFNVMKTDIHPAGVSGRNIRRHDVSDVQKPLSVAGGKGRGIAHEFNSLSIE